MVVGIGGGDVLIILDRSALAVGAAATSQGLVWLFLLVLPWFIAIYSRVGSFNFCSLRSVRTCSPKSRACRKVTAAPPGFM